MEKAIGEIGDDSLRMGSKSYERRREGEKKNESNDRQIFLSFILML